MMAPIRSMCQRLRLVPFLLLVLFILAGCDNYSNSPPAEQSISGNLQISLLWNTETIYDNLKAASPSGDICKDFGIEQIRILVKNRSGDLIKASDLLPCDLHSTRFDKISVGTGYRVEVEALIDKRVLWYGEKSDVTVQKKSPMVQVEMTYRGDQQPPPTATISPVDTATNVHTEIEITISFDKEVVEASVNKNSVALTDGDHSVSGTVTYDPMTRKAVFKPDQPLSILTTYTVTVTTDVMDRFGQRMAQDLSSKFITSIVWFVDGDRTASGSGQSWDEAFNTLQEALDASNDGDQIWVKQGDYALDKQLTIDKPVWILGGFAGTETQHFHRDWKKQKTSVHTNGGHYRSVYISADAVLNGFVFTASNLLRRPDLKGGTMFIDGASPQINNCIFNGLPAGSSAGLGGAIYLSAGDPKIIGCTFSNNSAAGPMLSCGGAIYNEQGGPTIVDCLFKNNGTSHTSGYGGAIYNNNAKSTTLIKNCRFIENSASGTDEAYGGAIYNHQSDVSILACRFEGNTRNGGGGGGGSIFNHSSDITVQNSVFNESKVDSQFTVYGGAIGNRASNPAIANCTFYANQITNHMHPKETYGGAIASYDNSRPTIVNTVLWANKAQTGSQLYDDDSSSTTVSFSNIDQALATGNQNFRKDPKLGADLHLRPGSPCIGRADNSSSPELDIDGERRPQKGAADVGADEFMDEDEDLLPDYWEDIHDVDIATADEDRDGIPNLSEFFLGMDPNSPERVLNATGRGNVQSDGSHQAADKHTPIEISGARSFFIFTDIPIIANHAALRLELVEYKSDSVPETVQIWDVSTDVATLTSDTVANAEGLAVYEEIGSGRLLGEFEVNPTDEKTTIDIELNTEAIEAIGSAYGRSEAFTIGISIEEHAGAGRLLFSEANENRIHQLVLR